MVRLSFPPGAKSTKRKTEQNRDSENDLRVTSNRAAFVGCVSCSRLRKSGNSIRQSGADIGSRFRSGVTHSAVSLILLAFFTAAAFAATPAFVQRTSGQIASGSGKTVSLSRTTAGNLLAVYVIWDNTGPVTIADTAQNTYSNAVGPTFWSSGRYSAQVFYAKNIAGGADSITATFGLPVRSFGIIYVTEYSGIDRVSPVDVTASAIGTGKSLSSGSTTTTSASDLIYSAGVSDNVVTSAGTGFSSRDMSFGNITEDRVGATPGSYAGTATHNGKLWAMQMVAFKAAGTVVVNDTTAPSVPTGLAGVAVSTSQINLFWNASTDPDNAAGQISYSVYRNGMRVGTTAPGTTTWTDSGLATSTTYSYSVAAADTAGNQSGQSAVIQVTTKSTPPTISGFSVLPVAIITGQSSTLSWTVSNATSASIDNSIGAVSSSGSIVVRPVVTTTYTLTATNGSGTTTAQTVVSVGTDNVAPSVPSINATAVSSSQINVSWTASSDNVGVTGYQLYRDGIQILQTSGTSFSDSGLLASHSYSYTVAARDAAGNVSALSSPATATTNSDVDTQAPTVAVISPVMNQSLIGTTTVQASATDNVGVVGVQFSLDGANLGAEVTTAPFATAWDTTQVPDGPHTLAAAARDAAGNTSTSPVVGVVVNNSARRPYVTTFPNAESVISENNNWVNGKSVGIDWADVQTIPGLAYGTQTGDVNYSDSTALLTGNWGADQTVQATVHSVNQSDGFFEEVELRLRSVLAAHKSTGYEVNFRCSKTANAYAQIVRWNGALGDFTMLDARGGAQYGVQEGDVVKATVIGNVITAYINDVQVLQVTDNTFSTGSPGMGFYIQGTTGSVDQDFGFTKFSASDGSSTDTTPPSTPTNLSATAVSQSQINLSWTASTDDVVVSGYQIYRNNVQIATSSTSSYSDTGLNANTTYTYLVVAVDGAGHLSPASAIATATTPAPDITPPSVPLNLTASSVTSNSVTLSWAASTDDIGVAGYQVFRNGTLVGSPTTMTFTDVNLSPGTAYTYTVAAFDFSSNTSLRSDPLVVTTSTTVSAPPKFVQVNQNMVSTGAKVSVALKNATVQGNTIVAYVIWSNTGPAVLTDTRGNTFTPVSAPLVWGGKYSAQIFYASNLSSGADTVTASFGTSVNSFGVIYVHEYSGISTTNPVEATIAAAGSSSTLDSGPVASTSQNELVFGAGVSDNNVTAPGAGFTSRDIQYGNVTEDRVTSTAGSYSATATHSGTNWGMQVVLFRPK